MVLGVFLASRAWPLKPSKSKPGSMSEETCVLVRGIGEIASAVARRLFVEERTVAIQQATPPRTVRRRMAFSDAWFDGAATLDGVEARRADLGSEFLLGLRTRQFIPVLTQRFSDVVGRWPWDVIVAAPDANESFSDYLKSQANFTIGLGASFIAGVDCDLVIETEGPDPGALLRDGAPPPRRPVQGEAADGEPVGVRALTSGLFQTTKIIGALVDAGEPLGSVAGRVVPAPVSGRICGLIRKRQAVIGGELIGEIATSSAAPAAGVSYRNNLIARAVAFAVEMEVHGYTPVSYEQWR